MAQQRTDSPRRLIIVPAFNEAASIVRVVNDLHTHLPDFDILVVDDGSTDRTARNVPSIATTVSLPFNQGIGGAMQTGYRYAKLHGYDVAVQVDGDGQHPANQVRHLVDHLESNQLDMVIGSRFLGNKSYVPPAPRMLAIRFLRTLVSALSGKTITDCTSGFRAANKHAIHAFAHWYPEDYPEPEVILLLQRAGYKTGEVPVEMAARTTGTTSIPFFRGMFYVLKVSAALLLDLCRNPWPREKVTPT